jgi:hypothetical protein
MVNFNRPNGTFRLMGVLPLNSLTTGPVTLDTIRMAITVG